MAREAAVEAGTVSKVRSSAEMERLAWSVTATPARPRARAARAMVSAVWRLSLENWLWTWESK